MSPRRKFLVYRTWLKIWNWWTRLKSGWDIVSQVKLSFIFFLIRLVEICIPPRYSHQGSRSWAWHLIQKKVCELGQDKDIKWRSQSWFAWAIPRNQSYLARVIPRSQCWVTWVIPRRVPHIGAKQSSRTEGYTERKMWRQRQGLDLAITRPGQLPKRQQGKSSSRMRERTRVLQELGLWTSRTRKCVCSV